MRGSLPANLQIMISELIKGQRRTSISTSTFKKPKYTTTYLQGTRYTKVRQKLYIFNTYVFSNK